MEVHSVCPWTHDAEVEDILLTVLNIAPILNDVFPSLEASIP